MKIPILIPNIFDHPFTYESNIKLNIGEYVIVPFGKSEVTGVVWDHFEITKKKKFKIKKIIKKLNIIPLKIGTVKFLNWFSEYNLIPKGMSLKLHLLSNEAIENFNNKSKIKMLQKYLFKKKKILIFKKFLPNFADKIIEEAKKRTKKKPRFFRPNFNCSDLYIFNKIRND